MRNTRLYILAFLFFCIGVAFFTYKAAILHFPLSPNTESSVFTVEARFFFSARSNGSIKARLLIPRSSDQFMITDENFVSRGYGLTTSLKDGNRRALWSIRSADGDQYLYYRAIVHQLEDSGDLIALSPPEIEVPDYSGHQAIAAKGILDDIQKKSADLDTLIFELVKELEKAGSGGAVATLMDRRNTMHRKAQVAVELLALAEIPARVVHGLELVEESRNTKIIQWIEVLEDGTWRPFALSSKINEFPRNYLPWWRGTTSLYYLKGGENAHIAFAVRRNQEAAIDLAVAEGRITDPLLVNLSLFSLPIDTQGVYRILLLLPLGALIVVIARNLIGLQCFGTFMPVLMAVAFRNTGLFWGISLFTLVVFAGLFIRFSLEKLKLLLVPRMAVVLTSVILLFACISVLTHKLGFERSVYVALFPMVIITMVIERMSIVWDEQGSAEAFKQGGGSLLVSVLVYAVITYPTSSHLLFVFPELNLVLLAIMLLLGRYTGYRFLEFFRFKAFLKEE